MENASKALIIAGAILISIIIIGLGVYFVNMASSAGKKVNLDSQAAQAQNSQFMDYLGDKKTSAEVKSLMSLITTNNITGDTGDETKRIYVAWADNSTDSAKVTTTTKISQSVKPGTTYSVTIPSDTAKDDAVNAETEVSTATEGYYSTGYIKVIVVKANKAKTS